MTKLLPSKQSRKAIVVYAGLVVFGLTVLATLYHLFSHEWMNSLKFAFLSVVILHISTMNMKDDENEKGSNKGRGEEVAGSVDSADTDSTDNANSDSTSATPDRESESGVRDGDSPD